MYRESYCLRSKYRIPTNNSSTVAMYFKRYNLRNAKRMSKRESRKQTGLKQNHKMPNTQYSKENKDGESPSTDSASSGNRKNVKKKLHNSWQQMKRASTGQNKKARTVILKNTKKCEAAATEKRRMYLDKCGIENNRPYRIKTRAHSKEMGTKRISVNGCVTVVKSNGFITKCLHQCKYPNTTKETRVMEDKCKSQVVLGSKQKNKNSLKASDMTCSKNNEMHFTKRDENSTSKRQLDLKLLMTPVVILRDITTYNKPPRTDLARLGKKISTEKMHDTGSKLQMTNNALQTISNLTGNQLNSHQARFPIRLSIRDGKCYLLENFDNEGSRNSESLMSRRSSCSSFLSTKMSPVVNKLSFDAKTRRNIEPGTSQKIKSQAVKKTHFFSSSILLKTNKSKFGKFLNEPRVVMLDIKKTHPKLYVLALERMLVAKSKHVLKFHKRMQKSMTSSKENQEVSGKKANLHKENDNPRKTAKKAKKIKAKPGRKILKLEKKCTRKKAYVKNLLPKAYLRTIGKPALDTDKTDVENCLTNDKDPFKDMSNISLISDTDDNYKAPAWTKKRNLKRKLLEQHRKGQDPFEVFGSLPQTPVVNLAKIFNVNRSSFNQRSSSARWK